MIFLKVTLEVVFLQHCDKVVFLKLFFLNTINESMGNLQMFLLLNTFSSLFFLSNVQCAFK